ncbi:acetyltransferase (GNAT) family protein [Paenibacillus sp. BK033]|uniref:GNAT family N-acetyltransferase n=1 Tax=Paenibacillus sp. BK033 TaxID=2512133 RepID=UPI001051EA90|nr:GNAT family N-acetyltransferase [Paenibacillus sp. BK033]TCN00712.1 acetyltransferase (GNAT) family protein [Paenibacillus sp. BK033]
MIRARNPKTDDKEIFRLIQAELIPMSHTAHPLDAQTIRDLPVRFRRGVTYVAAEGKTSKPYGFIRFEVTGELLYLDMLVVHPDHRNRQWGRKLLLAAEAYGLTQNCRASRLFVDDINARAKNLYARLGYQAIQYYPELRCYEMIKPLASSSYPSY